MSSRRLSAICRLFLCILSLQTVLACPLRFAHEASHESPRNLDATEWLDRRAIAKNYKSRYSVGISLWMDRTMWYRYTDDAAKKALDADVKKAWKVWKDALPKGSGFKFQELPADSDPEAVNNYLLMISYHKPVAEGGDGKLSTTVGLPSGILGGEGLPTMMLSNDTTKGTKNVVTNYAHEIGHAWGFLHPHQNPNYWSTEFKDGQGGAIFTKKNWHPKNLADYEETIQFIDGKIAAEKDAKKKEEWEARKTTMLTDYSAARSAGFAGGLEWLPLPKAVGAETEQKEEYTLVPDPASPTTSKTDIDWESIMLYPSFAGAKEGLSVLTRANGDKMVANTKPSQKDIDALMAMYKDEEANDSSEDDR